MQTVLEAYLVHYNAERPHQGCNMNGRTPAQAFKDGLPDNQPKKEKTPPNTKAA